MGLTVQHLELDRFRNLEHKSIEFSPSLTVLVGHNAVGKTNTIEALQLLTCGRSFRRPAPAELLLQGAQAGSAELTEEGDGRLLELKLELSAEKRRFLRNGKPLRPGDVAGELISILFSPDDLSFVKGSPSRRRDELDAFGSQMNKAYRRLVGQYEKAVEQRNHLLKDPWCDEGLLAVWDESVALGGAQLLGYRYALFSRLKERYVELYRTISPGEVPDVRYVSSSGEVCTTLGKDELRDYLLVELQKHHAEERRRGRTLIGPHRDDLQFYVDGRDARTFGSQGQQRTAVLAWKMAEVEVVEQIRNEKPLLLLDDVMSELDELRREALTGFVQRGVQMVVTTTNLGYFSEAALAEAHIVHYGDE